MEITNSTFISNTARQGGGAIDNSSTVTVTNSTFAGNVSELEGGAIRNFEEATGTVTLRNIIMVNNSVSNTNTSTVTSTLAGPEIVRLEGCYGPIIDGGGNVQWPATDNSCPGFHGDPKLGDLGAYGGPTPTLPITGLDSAAYRRATADYCPLVDQRGFQRVRQGACDAGAYELAPAHGWLPELSKNQP
ncbi:MAG: hypothetical protein IPK16_25940 [Anaerolineales bacterium]|nr:hypothetical protein [Anaerolineales bacterium]